TPVGAKRTTPPVKPVSEVPRRPGYLFPMSVHHPMPPDLERKLYLEGIELFNDHEFFEAHETWEEIWHMAYGLKHQFYQGLIQCAVALEHYLRSNPRGVMSLYKSYQTKFKDVPG